jgi:hypothetical protein
MRLGIERVQSALPRVAEVPLGGTATGTGINTPLGFPQKVIELLAAETRDAADEGHPLAPPADAGQPLVVAQRGAGVERPTDVFVEVFDEASRQMFFYEATTGVSQWQRPAMAFAPFRDGQAAAGGRAARARAGR